MTDWPAFARLLNDDSPEALEELRRRARDFPTILADAMSMVPDTTERAARRNPAYRALVTEAHLLDSVLDDIEDARDLNEALRIIGQRKERVWRRSREALAEEAARDAAVGDVPGWNGAGASVEADRG